MRNFDEYAFHVLGEEHRQEAEECDWLQAIAEQRQVSHDNDTKDVNRFPVRAPQLQNYDNSKVHRIIDNFIKRQYIISRPLIRHSRLDCFEYTVFICQSILFAITGS